MKFRPDNPSLHHAWVAGCLFSGLLLVMGVASWFFDAGTSHGALVGYGVGAVAVLILSRGLYHRSIVSGSLLLMVALGPIVQETVQWTMGVSTLSQSASMFIEWTIALCGLGLGIAVIRGIYDLSSTGRASTPRTSRQSTRFT